MFSLASPAVASQAPIFKSSASVELSCDEQVDAAVEAEGLSGEAVDFTCSPAGATVELATDDSIELSTEYYATATDTGRVGSRSSYPCSVAAPYSRWITNEIEEKYSVCLIYGQRQPSGETIWWDAVHFAGTNWPGWNGHMLTGSADTAYTNPGSISFDVGLWKNNAGFFLQEIDFQHYEGLLNSITSIGGPTYLYNNGGSKTGIYHFRIRNVHLEVPMFNYSTTVIDAYEGYRFLCNYDDDHGNDQCRWPDGNEAPWI